MHKNGKGKLTTKDVVYLTSDHLNTPRIGTDANAQVVWRWEGDAFGDTKTDNDPDDDDKNVTVNLRFPGQYFDAETGLHYNWNRYYDPKNGRYITSDPVGLFAGLNSYEYSFNNSLRWNDPWGLWAKEAHDYLIRKYGELHGLNEAQIRAMMRGSAYADSPFAPGSLVGHQGAQFAPIHMMTSDVVPSKSDACRLANDFFVKNFNRYQDSLKDRRLGDPYFWLGAALHPVMDGTSPAHKGFQHWDSSQIGRHGSDRFLVFPRPDTEESLNILLANPHLIGITIELMEAAIASKRVDCECER